MGLTAARRGRSRPLSEDEILQQLLDELVDEILAEKFPLIDETIDLGA